MTPFIRPLTPSSAIRPGLPVGLALAALLLASAAAAQPSAQPTPFPLPAGTVDLTAPGSLDRATADRLVGDYFRRVVKRLPADWRQAEEEKMKKEAPGLGPHGLVQFLLPSGIIAFQYQEDLQRLDCFALVHKVRDDFPKIGLSRAEIWEGLAARRDEGAPMGGGDLVYDADSDGFWMHRVYLEPPASEKRMFFDLDRLTKAGEAWFREHYSEAVAAQAERMRPPASATAASGPFRATLAITADNRYIELWERPVTSRYAPQLVTRTRHPQGTQLYFPVFFEGAAADAAGNSRVELILDVVYPDGSAKASGGQALAWDGPARPRGFVQYSRNSLSLPFTEREPLGRYLVRARACDRVAERCVELEHPVEIVGSEGT